MSGNDDSRKRRVAIIGISSFLLLAMVVAVTVGVGMNNNDKQNEEPVQVSATMKAIQDICQPTDYKEACVQSLNATAGNTTDPIELIKAAFNAAALHVKEVANRSTTLQQLEKEPRAKMALDQCKELMNHAVDEFNYSINKLGKFDISKTDDLLADIKIWLSAAISYQETCLDGFQNTSSAAEEKMRNALKLSMQLSSNGLAIVDQISATLQQYNSPGINGRRLLQTDDSLPVLGHGEIFPGNWVNPGTRRLLTTHSRKLKPNIIVAQDGSGRFKTINEALEHVPENKNKTFVIYIKEGIYNEYVQINKSMTHLMMIGDGANRTRITGNKNFIDGVTTFRTATVAVLGDNFIAKNIGFENSAGAIKHQAVALRVQADMSIFYNCSIDGYQDTLYAHTKRQFYRDCTISGTIDFIFGDAAAVFQNCTFLIRKPLDNQQCIVTAQGRKESRQPSAIVLQNCTITADADLYANRTVVKSYLGRPWKEYSRTVIMESYIDDLIQADGWMPWTGDFGLQTCYYTEYNNWGPGSSKAMRVKWPGIKSITTKQAKRFTAQFFIEGDRWISHTGVPYNSGLFTKDIITNVTDPEPVTTNSTAVPSTTTLNVTAAAPGVTTNATAITGPGMTVNETSTANATAIAGPGMTRNRTSAANGTATGLETPTNATLNGTITVSNANATANATATGLATPTNAKLNGTITVSNATANGSMTAHATTPATNATLNGTVEVTNATTANGTVTMTNATTANESTTVNATAIGHATTTNATVKGSVTATNATNGGATVTANATVSAAGNTTTNVTVEPVSITNATAPEILSLANATSGGILTNVTEIMSLANASAPEIVATANATTGGLLTNATAAEILTLANATANGTVVIATNATTGEILSNASAPEILMIANANTGGLSSNSSATEILTIANATAPGLLSNASAPEIFAIANATAPGLLSNETSPEILSIANATAPGLVAAAANATTGGLVTATNDLAAEAAKVVAAIGQ